MTVKKNNDKRGLIASLVAVIVLLSLTSIISLIYNLVGGFYNARVATFDKILGAEQVVEIDGAGAYVCSLNFTGTLVTNTDIIQNVTIKNGENTLYVRAKMSFAHKDPCGKIFGYSNWVLSEDGYIYLNQEVQPFENVGVCKYLRFNDELGLNSHKNYIVSIVIETSETQYFYEPV